jgi:hypothetical protein
MNSDAHQNGQVIDLYWALTPAVSGGVVDAVRTTLTKMVGELRATMPDFNAVPSEPAATNAVHFAVTGKQNKINVVAAQGESSVPAPSPEETSSGRMKAAAWVLGDHPKLHGPDATLTLEDHVDLLKDWLEDDPLR